MNPVPPEEGKVGFAIGNGLSRLGIDLDRLKKHGPVVGCNALYRDWTPDALVCVDSCMVEEALSNGYEGPLFTAWMDYARQPPARYVLKEVHTGQIYPSQTIPSWASGPVSLGVAHLFFGCTKVILVGHDFNQSPDGTSQNVYIDTPNYDKTGANKRNYAHLITTFTIIRKRHPAMRVYRAGPLGQRLPALDGVMKWITFDQMWAMLEGGEA